MIDRPVTYTALLRGINVGGHSSVSMTELKLCFEKMGFSNVKTYINSGNVIFQTNATDARSLEVKIEKALEAKFKLPIVVVVRSFDEIQKLMRQLPSSWKTDTKQKCNVIFLRHTIDSPDILRGLNPKAGIEELYYRPGVLFWSATTSDLTKGNMIKLSRNSLYKEMTIRNLNTTRKIYALMNPMQNIDSKH